MSTRSNSSCTTWPIPKKALVLQRFFKTGPGQYGEGDRFSGNPGAPTAPGGPKPGWIWPRKKVVDLLKSAVHEERMTALLIWTYQFARAADHRAPGNNPALHGPYGPGSTNWDLVDVSAPPHPGRLSARPGQGAIVHPGPIGRLMGAPHCHGGPPWPFIRRECFEDTLAIARLLLKDDHDLIHKGLRLDAAGSGASGIRP